MNDKTECRICSVCGRPLIPEDDTVFCPECGAPYHRECFQQKGECIFSELHGTPDAFTPDMAEELHRRFSAGEPLRQESGPKQPPEPEEIPQPPEYENQAEPRRPEAADPYTAYRAAIRADALGGFKETDDIGGVTAGDAARFVVFNPQRYVPLFAKMARAGKRCSFNFFAFLLPECWFFFRKQFKPGIAVSLILAAFKMLTYPATLFLSSAMPADLSRMEQYRFLTENIAAIPAAAMALFLAGVALNFLLRLLCGIFGDLIYQKHAFRKIQEFRKIAPDAPEDELVYLGGINPFLILLGTAITSFLPTILLAFL